jgi:hypothetical protein
MRLRREWLLLLSCLGCAASRMVVVRSEPAGDEALRHSLCGWVRSASGTPLKAVVRVFTADEFHRLFTRLPELSKLDADAVAGWGTVDSDIWGQVVTTEAETGHFCAPLLESSRYFVQVRRLGFKPATTVWSGLPAEAEVTLQSE